MNARYALAAMFTAFACDQAMAQAGSLDISFGTNGIVTAQPGDFHDVGYDILALPDNTTLVCGVARHGGRNAIFITHRLEDGSPDVAFGPDQGYTFFNIGEEAYGYAMGRDSQGRIYVAGLAYPSFSQSVVVLVRTDANGIPDASYGNFGALELPIGTHDAEAKALVVLPNDDVLLAGSVVGNDFVRDAMIVRITSAGSVDPGFGVNGYAIADGMTGESLLNDIATLEDGSIVGVGYTDVSFVQKTFVMKTDASGSPVATFGTNGLLLPTLPATDHSAWGVIASGTNLLLTGTMTVGAESDIYVGRIMEDATYDPSFNSGAPLMIDLLDHEVGFDLVENSGQIYVCGTTGVPGFGSPRDFFIAKLNDAGVVNAAFGAGGSTVTSVQADFDDANALCMQPDGKLVAAGFTAGFSTGGDNDVAMVRYLDDGTTDIAFQAASAATLYPTPAIGNTVTVITACTGKVTCRILDAAGRQVSNATTGNGSSTLQLDIATLVAGRYVVLITDGILAERHALVIAP